MDWTQDGIVDILSGCYWSDDADAAHIQLLAGRGDMDFAPAKAVVTVAGVPLTNVKHEKDENDPNDYELRNICTHQFAVDYDADGDLDLVNGCFGAEFFFVEDTGGDGEPALADVSEQLDLQVPGGHAGPHLADWDGDGDFDLLSGSGHGGAYLAENVGSREKPEWAPFKELIAPPRGSVYEQSTDDGGKIVPATSTRVWAYDWNQDGLLDLLVGDMTTISNRKPGITPEEFAKRKAVYDRDLAEFQKSYQEVSERYMEAMNNAKDGEVDEKLVEEFTQASQGWSEIYEKKAEFQDERRTGFVWLYIRKPRSGE